MTLCAKYHYISLLPWKEAVKEYERIHLEFKAADANWSVSATARELTISSLYLGRILEIAKKLELREVKFAKNINHAWTNLEARQKAIAAETNKEIENITEELLKNLR